LAARGDGVALNGLNPEFVLVISFGRGEGLLIFELVRVDDMINRGIANVVVVDCLVDLDGLAKIKHISPPEILDLLIIMTILFRVINIFNIAYNPTPTFILLITPSQLSTLPQPQFHPFN
jgi:hypothetical protein